MHIVSITKWTCPKCGKVIKFRNFIPPIYCRCGYIAKECIPCETIVEERKEKKPTAICSFRKEEFRLEPCTTCTGTMIKIYQCEKNGECQLGRYVDGVKVCNGYPSVN